MTELIAELRDEAGLCRNEGADDIAALLDRAADALEEVEAENALLKNGVRK